MSSFFQLTPGHDPEPAHHAICAECAAKQEAHVEAAMALGDALLDALNAYAAIHEGTTYAHILEALCYMQYTIQRELDAESADA